MWLGYLRKELEDAFVRYLPPSPTVTTVTSAKERAVFGDFDPLQKQFVTDRTNDESSGISAIVTLVTLESPLPSDPVEILDGEDAAVDSMDPFATETIQFYFNPPERSLLVDFDPLEASYLREERLGIQEFGS